jgi:hypothetical protein
MSSVALYLETGEISAYAVRRVNPFLGVLQVIETQGGRATSSNGVLWQIELRTEHSGMWGSLNRNVKQVAYYRYGLWSSDEGLVSRPLAPHLDREKLTSQYELLIDAVQQRLQRLPFKLIDNRELWLFDKDGRQPLALLASLKPGDRPPSPEPRYWQSCLGREGIASQYRYPQSRELEALIKRAASANIRKYWVNRDEDGSGIVAKDGEHIRPGRFPGFLINTDWENAAESQLVNNYLTWIAPSLLSLQQLGRNERSWLEDRLNVQAVSVEHHWQLYPETVDDSKLTAARVQCRLQKAR